MTEQLRVEGMAEEFWSLTGITPSYPCDIEYAAMAAFSLPTVRMDGLDIAKARDWAAEHAIPFHFPARNRSLHGYLLANARAGAILLETTDTLDEQRYTIAHECAHFILECWYLRRRAEEAFGEGIISVLEGHRPPTLDERLEALLNDLPLRLIGHLMERPLAGPPSMAVLDAEDSADRLALELLAPFARLIERMTSPAAPRGYQSRRAYLTSMLKETYGLPVEISMAYGQYILRSLGEPTFRDWLAEDL